MTIPGMFVVGTDTGVGKTRVASLIGRSMSLRGCSVGVLKPVATGASRRPCGAWCSEDAESLIAAVGAKVELHRVSPILFEKPLAPCIAARSEGQKLTQTDVEQSTFEAIEWWSDRAEVLVVEGVGGLHCPLADDSTIADLAVALDYPVLIVGRRGLGTLNHCLLTVEAALSRSLRIAGIVLNGAEPSVSDYVESSNADELSRRLPGIAVLAELAFQEEFVLPGNFHAVDWKNRASLPRIQHPKVMRG